MILSILSIIIAILVSIIILFFIQVYTLTLFSINYRHKFISLMSKVVLFLLNARLDVKNIEYFENNQSCLLVGNHLSLLDTVVLSSLDKHISYIGKKEVNKMPVVPILFKANESLYLDRDNIRESLKVIKEASRRVEAGETFVIFPEGTRSRTGELGEFKPGAYKLATLAKAPIVPFSLKNTEKVFKNFPKRTNLTITFHNPITISEYKELKPIELNEVVVDRIKCGL